MADALHRGGVPYELRLLAERSAGRLGATWPIVVGGRNEWANINVVQLVRALVDARLGEDPAPAARFLHAPAARGTAAESLITYVAERPGHDRGYVIDASKIEHELGFGSEETFETGIAKTVDWFLSNESWSRSVMDGSYRT